MLRDTVNDALKEAMKSQDKRRVSTLRLINAAIKNADIEARGKKEALADDALHGVLQKMIKQRQGIGRALRQGRPPRARRAGAGGDRDHFSGLPKQMSDLEAGSVIQALVHEIHAQSLKDMGRTMAALKERIRRQDGFRQGFRQGEGAAELSGRLRRLNCPSPFRLGKATMKRIPWIAALIRRRTLIAPATAGAEDYPTRPIRVLTTTSAGGISDIFMRALGEELRQRLGQPIVVENRPGGMQNVGARACTDAPPTATRSASSMPIRWSTTSSCSRTCRSIPRRIWSRSPTCST